MARGNGLNVGVFRRLHFFEKHQIVEVLVGANKAVIEGIDCPVGAETPEERADIVNTALGKPDAGYQGDDDRDAHSRNVPEC